MPLEGSRERQPILHVSDGKPHLVTFEDEGRDVQAGDYGASSVCSVDVDGKKMELWVRRGGPLAIGLQDHVPVTGKKLKILAGNEKDKKFTAGVPKPKTARYKVTAV